VEHSGFTSWNGFFADLGLEGAAVETLRVTYRSSREIMHFAQLVLGDLLEDDEPAITTRKGPPVEIFRFTDRGACVAFLADALRDLCQAEPLASVAILTHSATASELYFQGLSRSEIPRLRRVVDQEFSFEAGIEVTEIEQVKGLEFDYVILMDVDAQGFPDTPAARRLLHVGATRAIHQLWMTSVGTPSPLVRGLSEREDAE
jgi:DNA helicase-2/ATP-dependent DNA helicase PcrA